VSDVIDSGTVTLAGTARVFAAASLAFALDVAAGGVGPLKPIEALLVLAINQANIAPMRRDPEARAKYGKLDAAAPDEARRPVSINAVAASLGLPFETVRRRIRRLVAEGVCDEAAAGVLVPQRFLLSGPYLQTVVAAHHRLRAFYFQLKREDMVGRLREPNYDEDDIPIRAAAGLLSDYMLRTVDALMREAGDAISGLVLLVLLAGALNTDAEGRPDPQALSVRRIHQRLGLPEETVRRHLLALAEEGDCARAGRGFEVTEAMLGRPGLRTLLADNETHVQRLLAGLAERGVINAWEQAEAGR
jgi:hypothetical protein